MDDKLTKWRLILGKDAKNTKGTPQEETSTEGESFDLSEQQQGMDETPSVFFQKKQTYIQNKVYCVLIIKSIFYFLLNLKTMKKTLICFVLMATSLSIFAQKTTIASKSSPSDAARGYLGFSTGFNNIAGFIGATYEHPLSATASGKIGLGLSGWGYKLGVAGKYYSQYPNSWSFGVGYSTSSGATGVPLELTTASSSTAQKITMNLDRAHSLDFVVGKSWGDKVRFGLEFGYAAKIGGGTYAPQDKTILLSSTSMKVLDFLVPSGLIFGMTTSFRL
jgi:hypothetical protein